MSGPCQVQLTCASEQEAEKVSKALLDKRLVACVKKIPISSMYRWQGKVESNNEVLLLMETFLENFNLIEQEVGKHHSYKTYVLQAIPLAKISKKGSLWLNKEVRGAKKG